MGNGTVKGGDNRRLRLRTFNIFQKIPFTKFVVRLCLPFSEVVVCSIVNNFWKLSLMDILIVGHDWGKVVK
jgi:hypothetical protein